METIRDTDTAAQQRSGNSGLRKTAFALLIAAAAVFLGDAIVFRSGWYFRIAEPDTAQGMFERELRTERQRARDTRKQILVVGDSRAQAIRPRLAEEAARPWSLAFANVAVLGSTPRAWYYLLRELDPNANQYDALILGVDDYDDNNDYSRGESTAEVEMAAPALRLADLFTYPWSFSDPGYRRDAFLECFLKGSAYKRDLQELISHPRTRTKKTHDSRADYAQFMRQWIGAGWSMAGLEVDWHAHKLKFPDAADASTRDNLQQIVDHPNQKDNGWKAELRREWIGRIANHYRNSRTLLIFARLPHTPIPIPPELRAPPMRGMLRDLAITQSNVVLLDEHLFDHLERPEYFRDYTHTNAIGSTEVTRIIVEQLAPILAKGRS